VVFINSQYPSLHLTISWGNKSGEVDIHMTRVVPDAPKLYSSIIKINESDIKRFAEWTEGTFAPQITSSLYSYLGRTKSIRPGWLRRRGYLVFWVPKNEQEHLIIDKLIKRHKKRAFRLYSNAFLNLNVSDAFEEHLYDPSILHFLARENGDGWIQAVPLIGRRKNRRKNLSLKFVNFPEGGRGWIAIDSLVPELTKVFEPLNQYLVNEMPKTLTRVFDELRLNELGIIRDEFINEFSSQ